MIIELYKLPLIKDPSLLSYWRLEGNSNDSKGSINGTDSNVAYGTDYGKFGQGVNFDSLDYIHFGNNFNFERTDSFSISLWIKHTSTGDGNILSKQDTDSPYPGWALSHNFSNTKLYFDLINNASTNKLTVSFPDDYNDGNWHHIAFTYDGTSTSAGCKGYIDGSPVTLTQVAQTLSDTIQTANNLQLCGREGANYCWVGAVDDVAIFNRVLTVREVTQIYYGFAKGIIV